MRKSILFIWLFLLSLFSVKAQWTVIDPSNLIQNTKTVFESSTTATNMVNNFKETVKIYEQSKQYYDALKSVNNLVRDAKKVQQTILMVGEISDIYVSNFQIMLTDENFTVDELNAIASGYAILLQESSDALEELKNVVNITTLSLTDKDRMDVVNSSYEKMRNNRNLIQYYTNKNIGVSLLRSNKKGETKRFMSLYGNNNEKYW